MNLNKDELIEVLEKWTKILDNDGKYAGPYPVNALGYADYALTWPRSYMWEFEGEYWERREDQSYPIICFVDLDGRLLFGADQPDEYREMVVEIDSAEELDKILTLQWEGDQHGVFEDEIPESAPKELVELRAWFEKRFPIDW